MLAISFQFYDHRPEDLFQLNRTLATLRLEDLMLKDFRAYLDTPVDAQGNLLHKRCGLETGTLVCRLAKRGGRQYQIDTAVADNCVGQEVFLRCWQNMNPHRQLCSTTVIPREEGRGYILIHCRKK